nr:peroxisomal and mitochondrial division factor 2-like [Ipomoea batatas]
MADESATNGDVFDDAEIGTNDDSKAQMTSAKIAVFRQLVNENEVINERAEKRSQLILPAMRKPSCKRGWIN